MEIRNTPHPPTSGPDKESTTLPADRFFDEVRKQRLDERRRSASVERNPDHGVGLVPFPTAGMVMAEPLVLLSAAPAGTAATYAAATATAFPESTQTAVADSAAPAGSAATYAKVTAFQGAAQVAVADQALVGTSAVIVPASGHLGQAMRTDGVAQAVAMGENRPAEAGVNKPAEAGGAHAATGAQHDREGDTRPLVAAMSGMETVRGGLQLSGGEPVAHGPGAGGVSDAQASAPTGALPLLPVARSVADGGTPPPTRQAESTYPQLHAFTTLQRGAVPLRADVSRASDASTAFNYAFSSWGSHHVVRVNMGSTRTTVQASSQLVDDGLRRTGVIEGVDVLAMDAGSDDQNPERERRGRQRRGTA